MEIIDNDIFEKLEKILGMKFLVAEQYLQFSFPNVKRYYAKQTLSSFVSVQPMPIPSGQIFHLDFIYNCSIKIIVNEILIDINKILNII